jgi:basic membrane protein A and related proteins
VTIKHHLILIFLTALIVSACTARPQDCARADVFCAGLVTDFGSIHEGINQEAWLGLQDAKNEHLVDRIDAIETSDVRDRTGNISTFAKDGYDVIITVGASISDETMTAAREYPNLSFIGVEQPQDPPLSNLTGLVFHEDRAGFLSGALAALTTQTNRVAALCEENYIDPMRRYCDGFQAGANYIDPDMNVTVSYRDGSQENLFDDPAWGHATAVGVIHEGADVLFAAGNNTADAVLETAAQQRVNVIGAETDPYARLTDVRPWLITSAVNEIRPGIHDLMRLARDEKLPSGNYFGESQLAPFHEWERQIPQSSKDRLIIIENGLADGTILTGIPWSLSNSSPQNP